MGAPADPASHAASGAPPFIRFVSLFEGPAGSPLLAAGDPDPDRRAAHQCAPALFVLPPGTPAAS